MPAGRLNGLHMVTDLVHVLEAALQHFGAQTSIRQYYGGCSTMEWLKPNNAQIQTISGRLRLDRFLKHIHMWQVICQNHNTHMCCKQRPRLLCFIGPPTRNRNLKTALEHRQLR